MSGADIGAWLVPRQQLVMSSSACAGGIVMDSLTQAEIRARYEAGRGYGKDSARAKFEPTKPLRERGWKWRR